MHFTESSIDIGNCIAQIFAEWRKCTLHIFSVRVTFAIAMVMLLAAVHVPSLPHLG